MRKLQMGNQSRLDNVDGLTRPRGREAAHCSELTHIS